MKQVHRNVCVRNSAHRSLSASAMLIALLGYVAGCDTGEPQSQIRGVKQSAPPLSEFDDRGNYSPYYATAEMNTPRYFHEGQISAGGLAIVFGGSDERALASLDTVEIFDQSNVDTTALEPESISGVWIDSDFEGEPILIPSGPRIFFSVDELADGRMVLIGGSTNLLGGPVTGDVEVFDPITRTFDPIDSELINPRFDHSTAQLSTGEFLIIGGQVETSVNVEDDTQNDNQGGFGGGGNGIPTQNQQTVFPSTNGIELFSPKDETFVTLETISGQESILQTQRGRSMHGMERFAGPDNRLNTPDDMFLLAGGYQTLSAASGQAPTGKGADQDSGDAVISLEIFDPRTRIFTLIANVRLNQPRLPYAEVVNLGEFNDFTPDGVLGVGNAILITHGFGFDDQVIIANFVTGAGPASGIRLFEVESNRTLSHIQGSEYGRLIGRGGVNALPMKRPLSTVQGVEDEATWIVALAGFDEQVAAAAEEFRAGCIFDPFYSVRAERFFNLEPTDLANERSADPLNFLGIVGSWLTVDGMLSQLADDYGTSSTFPRMRANARIYLPLIPLPGVDGIRDTFDDRVLLSGGGLDGADGGEPATPSAEIFIPPGAGDSSVSAP